MKKNLYDVKNKLIGITEKMLCELEIKMVISYNKCY